MRRKVYVSRRRRRVDKLRKEILGEFRVSRVKALLEELRA